MANQNAEQTQQAAQAVDTPAPAPAEGLPVVAGPGVGEIPPAAPPAVPPTFAEALQAAISQFSTSVGALKSLDSDVDQAVDEKAAAQVALVAAQGSEKTKITNRDTGRVAAIDDRDALVGVLQSWAP